MCVGVCYVCGYDTYVCIIVGKKSASGQLVAVVEGKNTTQRGKKRREIAKINPKSKEKCAYTASLIFWLPSLLKFFQVRYVYIIVGILAPDTVVKWPKKTHSG